MTDIECRDEIMDGVYRALCTNGYADLTVQDIADECSKSTSLLHYHFDTKDELLGEFLEYILNEYECRVENRSEGTPVEQLCAFIARYVFGPDSERQSYHLALLEMRAQGPFDEEIRDQLVRSDELLRETVAEILESGIEAGEFEPVDVDRTAAFVVAALDGARTRQVTLGDNRPTDQPYTRTVAEETLSRVVDPLLTPETERPTLTETLADMPDWAER